MAASAGEPYSGTNNWERPWSTEELRQGCKEWTLAGDAGLLLHLQDFSAKLMTKTHEIEKSVHDLCRETRATDCRLHNTMNDFVMTANNQFVENRVYEDVVDDVAEAAEAVTNEPVVGAEASEAELVPKVTAAIAEGLTILKSRSKAEDGGVASAPTPLNRPALPTLVGSAAFFDDAFVGAGGDFGETTEVANDEILSDVGNSNYDDQDIGDAPAIVVGEVEDEEEENEEEEEMFAAPTPAPVAKPRAKSELKFLEDEEDPADSLFGAANTTTTSNINGGGDDGNDVFAPQSVRKNAQTISIFGNEDDDDRGGKSMFDDDEDDVEKGEEEDEVVKISPPSDERRNTGSIESSGDFDVDSGSVEYKEDTKQPLKLDFAAELAIKLGGVGAAKKANKIATPKEDNTTKSNESKHTQDPVPPKKTPRKLSALFAGDDNDEEEDEEKDMFSPVPPKSSLVPPHMKSKALTSFGGGLFDEDDEEEEDGFFAKPSPRAQTASKLPAPSVYIRTKTSSAASASVAASQPSPPPKVATKSGLFDDDEDKEDFFAQASRPSKPADSKVNLFVDNDDDDEFLGASKSKPVTKNSAAGATSIPAPLASLPISKKDVDFSDSDDDMFGSKASTAAGLKKALTDRPASEPESSSELESTLPKGQTVVGGGGGGGGGAGGEAKAPKPELNPGAVSMFGSAMPPPILKNAVPRQKSDDEDSPGWSSDEDREDIFAGPKEPKSGGGGAASEDKAQETTSSVQTIPQAQPLTSSHIALTQQKLPVSTTLFDDEEDYDKSFGAPTLSARSQKPAIIPPNNGPSGLALPDATITASETDAEITASETGLATPKRIWKPPVGGVALFPPSTPGPLIPSKSSSSKEDGKENDDSKLTSGTPKGAKISALAKGLNLPTFSPMQPPPSKKNKEKEDPFGFDDDDASDLGAAASAPVAAAASGNLLSSATKSRAKIQTKRRPPTRNSRKTGNAGRGQEKEENVHVKKEFRGPEVESSLPVSVKPPDSKPNILDNDDELFTSSKPTVVSTAASNSSIITAQTTPFISSAATTASTFAYVPSVATPFIPAASEPSKPPHCSIVSGFHSKNGKTGVLGSFLDDEGDELLGGAVKAIAVDKKTLDDDDDDLFSVLKSYRGAKQNHLDDDDDDIFSSTKSSRTKPKAPALSDDDDDIFAAPKTSKLITNGVSKPKSSPLNDDDDDIFANSLSLTSNKNTIKAPKKAEAITASSALEDPDDIFGNIKSKAAPAKAKVKADEPDDIFGDIKPKAYGKAKSQMLNALLDDDDDDIFQTKVKKTTSKKKDEFLDILDDDDEDLFVVKEPENKSEKKAKNAPRFNNAFSAKNDKPKAIKNQSIFGDNDDDIFK